MTLPWRSPAICAGLGAALLGLLVLPQVRHALEASMALHMLAQYPALMLAGAVLGAAMPKRLGRWLWAWNSLGLGGLAACALFLAVLMIPRLLDLALVEPRVECAKFVALLLAGAVLVPSWRAAGRVVQAFFLGNLLPMTVIAGTLYRDAPVRLCNAYRLDDQQQLGTALVWLAAAAACVWLLQVALQLSRPGMRSPSATHP